jgi:hypothetical protein
MSTTQLAKLEDEISHLAGEEQLWLIERLAYRLRESRRSPIDIGGQLAAMANDPQIIRELRAIEEDFLGTESDGLAGMA